MNRSNVSSLPLTIPIGFSVAPSEYPVFIPIRLFIVLRWITIVGQILAVGGIYFILDYDLPLGPISTIIDLSMIVNTLMSLPNNAETRLTLRQIPYYLIYDLGQLTTILFITGGLNNPFCILILAPTAVAATILSARTVIMLCALAILSISFLAFSPYPLPWKENGIDHGLFLPFPFLLGIAFALIVATVFVAFYVWTMARKTSQLHKALTATQLALAKEQKISSLGALAAAAAHELGSPLSTIFLASQEILSNLPPNSPFLEDVQLLVSQSERCRDILMELSRNATHDHQVPYQTLPLSGIIELAARPHQTPNIQLSIYKKSPDPEPQMSITPDLIHGLGNVLQNAFQFANSTVRVTLQWNKDMTEAIIQDDGPGYPPALLPRLGEPYSSGRNTAKEGHQRKGGHLGLGLFIAQTLLSQRQGQVHFFNDDGACCLIRWPGILRARNPEAPKLAP